MLSPHIPTPHWKYYNGAVTIALPSTVHQQTVCALWTKTTSLVSHSVVIIGVFLVHCDTIANVILEESVSFHLSVYAQY